jgi:heme-degrading monooxygenase HmoA
MAMIAIIWRFKPIAGAEARFEAANGPRGTWAELFRTAPGYVRTELLREQGGRYVTIDYWRSLADWDDFTRRRREAYAELDRACEALNETEERIGVFEVVEA